MWPELKKAKDNANAIENEIRLLLKSHNSLGKKDILRHSDTMKAETDEAALRISAEIEELRKNLAGHRKCLDAKSRFVKRHYSLKSL